MQNHVNVFCKRLYREISEATTHFPPVLRVALPRIPYVASSLFPIPCSATFEDIVAESWIAVLSGHHTFKAGLPVGPWLRTVVRNKGIQVLDPHKGSRRRVHVRIDDEACQLACSREDQTGDVDQLDEARQKRRRITKLALTKPPRDRIGLALKAAETEGKLASKALGVPSGTVRAWVATAWKEARACSA